MQSHRENDVGMEAMATRRLRARYAELHSHLGHRDARELDEVRLALKRLESGTWGRCEKCNGAIGRDRLRALPETRCCLDCTREP